MDGARDILGLWAGDGGEDVCMVVCDGPKSLPDAISAVWPQAITQTCVVHLPVLLWAGFNYHPEVVAEARMVAASVRSASQCWPSPNSSSLSTVPATAAFSSMNSPA